MHHLENTTKPLIVNFTSYFMWNTPKTISNLLFVNMKNIFRGEYKFLNIRFHPFYLFPCLILLKTKLCRTSHANAANCMHFARATPGACIQPTRQTLLHCLLCQIYQSQLHVIFKQDIFHSHFHSHFTDNRIWPIPLNQSILQQCRQLYFQYSLMYLT